MGMAVNQAWNNGFPCCINNMSIGADRIFRIMSYKGNPLPFYGHGIILQHFTGIYIQDSGVHYGHIGLFLIEDSVH